MQHQLVLAMQSVVEAVEPIPPIPVPFPHLFYQIYRFSPIMNPFRVNRGSYCVPKQWVSCVGHFRARTPWGTLPDLIPGTWYRELFATKWAHVKHYGMKIGGRNSGEIPGVF